MDGRKWLYETVKAALDGLNKGWTTYGSGSLFETPTAKPFAIIRMGQDFNVSLPGRQTEVLVWLHDEPGSYTIIDSGLSAVRTALNGVRTPLNRGSDGITCEHLGDSGDLADDGYKTITRYSTFQLVTSDR